jgi:hypothetical protein
VSTLLHATVYMFLHNLQNVIVQIENKMGLKKRKQKRKKKNYLAYRPSVTSQRSIYRVPVTRSHSIITKIFWHIHSFLGSDRVTSNETTAITLQQCRKYAAVLEPSLGNISKQK